jgi:hypothetical protein
MGSAGNFPLFLPIPHDSNDFAQLPHPPTHGFRINAVVLTIVSFSPFSDSTEFAYLFLSDSLLGEIARRRVWILGG